MAQWTVKGIRAKSALLLVSDNLAPAAIVAIPVDKRLRGIHAR
jgi:hypothetical protein